MSTAFLFVAIDVAAATCAAVLGARILAEFPRRANAQLVALILANTIAHVVLSREDYAYWIPDLLDIEVGGFRPVLNLLRNSTPGLFMILAHRLFVDGRAVPRWLLGLFVLQMLLEEPVSLLLTPDTAGSRLLEETAPALLQLCLVSAALYWSIAHWRIDLINARRRTRAAITIIIGFQTIASSLLLRAVIDQSSVAGYYVHEATVAAGGAICIFMLMRVSPGWIREHLVFDTEPPIRGRPPAKARKSESADTLAKLEFLLHEEKTYRQHGLSLAELAERLQLPEYRLRALIHEQLGFRNFNAFLHAYRIREACERLSDPAQARTPVTTIALSVGYQSLNTFNRGFREVTGTTPTEYREQRLKDEPPRRDPDGQATN